MASCGDIRDVSCECWHVAGSTKHTFRECVCVFQLMVVSFTGRIIVKAFTGRPVSSAAFQLTRFSSTLV